MLLSTRFCKWTLQQGDRDSQCTPSHDAESRLIHIEPPQHLNNLFISFCYHAVGWRKSKPNLGRKEVNEVSKKRLLLLSSGALMALLLVGVAGVALVFAQDMDPTTGEPCGFGRGFGWGGRSWTVFDAAAEALGLTPQALFTELHDAGKTLTDVAEEQGVDTEALQDAMHAARSEAIQQAIEQAVEDGNLSQEQADWLLEGLKQGFLPGGRGFGMGRGFDRGPFSAE